MCSKHNLHTEQRLGLTVTEENLQSSGPSFESHQRIKARNMPKLDFDCRQNLMVRRENKVKKAPL